MPYKYPDAARAYQRDYKRLRRAGENQTPGTTQLPSEFRLQQAADVLAVIQEQMCAVRGEEDLTLVPGAHVERDVGATELSLRVEVENFVQSVGERMRDHDLPRPVR